jgi:homoserine kinase
VRKVKIRLPATVTNLGPGINSLGLALGMYTSVDITERHDEKLVVETEGEGAGRYSLGLRHPVVLGIMRVFQHLERAPLGLTIRVENPIPLGSGLGVETAFWVAGIIGANNLMGNPFGRDAVLELAAAVSGQPDHAVTAVRGGLTTSTVIDGKITYRSLPVTSLRVVVALPEIDTYADDIEGVVPERVLLADALHNLSQIPMLLDALREGDHKLLKQVMDDRLYTPFLRPFIPGFDRVIELAQRAGASGITFSERGPALIFFASEDHRRLADTLENAFRAAGLSARLWILPVDTQGLVVSMAQSSA